MENFPEYLSRQQILVSAVLGSLSIVAGYYLGKRHSQAFNSVSADSEPELQEDEDPQGIPDGDLMSVTAGFVEPCKMVLIVRTDLKMSPGTVSTHQATLACYRALSKANAKLVRHWERTGQAKIALKGVSEEQLLELEAIAKSLSLCARAVHDKQLGTTTVLGIGPAPVPLVNQVTGKLRLL
ncbi:peptidyl-trna hydrolase 2 [Moniliophthora roreri MCA 2997]|uniref:peptidyl-tRNA hydrolase n=1 Tax=Moniliophthora roreri (strain MCA 2997) TaxID=1381753 RepID=V2Y010_MONRO|nr:peptidyl-trna hydrolase 2 [Moniliophthora roreri MCA 2997]